MRFTLFIIAFIALLNGLVAIFQFIDLLLTQNPDATVLQQISSRINIGLSLLVFAVAMGFRGVMHALDRANRQRSEIVQQARQQAAQIASVVPDIVSAGDIIKVSDDERSNSSFRMQNMPIMTLVVVAVVAAGYVFWSQLDHQGDQRTNRFMGGTLLTWTCSDGTVTISKVQPNASCVGR